ncbi:MULTISPECIES: ATP-binding protein [unclassified Janthinobacterium]|uniref:ATP-binding protein n=1 Tax=unclassified Janthinobacterium TaxID=2610881 RepID=UPI0018CA31FD|nr:ATP-binding protein [Janthinobacterium sp. CG_23.4]MDH6159696.1 signal transduction histidine kinase [Janthinobacterium sp. CG_23.4]
MIKHPSLLRRLVLWQAGAMVVAWLVLSIWIIAGMMTFGKGDLDQRMKTFASILAETASASGGAKAGDDAELRRRLAAAERIFIEGLMNGMNAMDGPAPLYQVWSSDMKLLHASAGAAAIAMPTRGAQFSEIEFAGHRYRAVQVTSSDASTLVTMTERAGRRFSAPLIKVVKVIGLSQLLILLWCLLVTSLAGWRGFKPIKALAQQLADRSVGDLSPLHAERLYSETAPVVQEVNALLAREALRLESERGFLSDAAHELRTPLAAINAQAHLLANTADPATRAVAVDELEQGMDRVSHLLEQLLTVARLEATTIPSPRETLDLAELCRQRLAPLSRLARLRAIELTLDSPGHLIASVQRAGFISILENLVDNAIRYTPSGGDVKVCLISHGRELELQVRDDGPGIAPEDRERVFERFVRLPGQVERGSGLGLSIVRRIVKAEGSTLQFIEGLSGRGIGFAVCIRQPTEPPRVM